MSPIGMILLFVCTLGFFSLTAHRRWRQLFVGGETRDLSLKAPELLKRIEDVLVYALFQKKMPYYRAAGFAHIAIFLGFQVLLLRTIVLWGRGFDADFDLWGLLARGTLLGDFYNVAKDLVALLVLGGCLVFVYFRLIGRGKADAVAAKPRMTLGVEGLIILGIISTMMLADLLYDGASLRLTAQEHGTPLHWEPFEPVGSLVAMMLSGVESRGTLKVLQHVGFWWHSSFVLIFLNILPFSKHFHIITSLPNVLLRDRKPQRLPKVEDLEGRVEREEPVGINRLGDLSWKHILDLYTCTECGRCSDNCPAYLTEKKLSPKHLTLALRDHLYDTEREMFGTADGVVPPEGVKPPKLLPEGQKEALHTYPPAPADGYFRSETVVDLVPNIVHPDVLWACTSCRACEEQCPVMISYVDKIVGMRRELMMIKAEFPPELATAFQGIETNGNPWNITSMDRAKWSDGLGIKLLADHPSAKVLYWVGCAAAFDDRAKKVARSVAKLLQKAGVDFAILGTEETCTGDPARRAGNEYLFQILAAQNVETLNGYGADKKTIITACPHCFNTLLNEYPDFGGRYDVVHHTDFLNGLLVSGKLVPTRAVSAKIAYHDSCYLGRYNRIYDSPRDILAKIPGVVLEEVPYWNRNKGLCCGAGGAQMFMEEHGEQRVNNKRTLQLLDTGAKTIASACPFCMTMLTDGLKHHEREADVEQLDIAELLARSIDLEARPAEAAE